MSKRIFLYSFIAIVVLFSIAAIAAVSGDLDQYNKADVAWQNGNLGKADYSEGLVVPFRLAVDGMDPSTQYTLTIGFDLTKNGSVGYDFLATYDATENPDLCADDPGSGAYSPLCDIDPTLASITTLTAAFVPINTVFDSPPHAPGLSIPGAISNSVALGNTNLTSFGAATLTVQPMVLSGSLATTSTGHYVVSFTTPATCTAGDCSVLLAWGGHLAQSSYWKTSTFAFNGAGAISGSSYHMNTEGVGGSQDRSIKTGSDLLTYLQVYKDLTATNHTDGLFNLLIGGVVEASDVTDGGTTGKLVQDITSQTSFTVSETAGTGTDLAWYFKNVQCYDRLAWPYPPAPGAVAFSGTNVLMNLATLTFNMVPGQDIYCVITNGDFPTAVSLASSSASEFLGLVTLNWATGFEDIGTVGFDVYRSESADDFGSKVNADLIVANGSGSGGGSYQFFDASVLPGKTYFYYIQLVDGAGASNLDVQSVDTFHYMKLPLLFK